MNKEHLLPIEKSRLGVIGGSGFYSMDQIEYLREIEINTPYGKPSDSIRVCLLYTSPSPRDLSTSRMPSSA